MEGFRWMRGARGLGAALVFLGFGAALLAYPAQVQRGLGPKRAVLPGLFGALPVPLYGAGQLWGALRGRGGAGQAAGPGDPPPVPPAPGPAAPRCC